jgi:riboflavin kinase/FMN adenylyltransferase
MRIVELRSDRLYGRRGDLLVDFPPVDSAVTVGSYDGVHVGHRKIIARMVSLAGSRNLRSVVVTFEPHPRLVLDGGAGCPVRLLTILEEKIDHLEGVGVDLLVVVRFDLSFSGRSSEDFIRKILVGLLGAKTVVVGYDHGFGRNRSGSGETLHRLAAACGFTVEVINEVCMGEEHVSSTRIRQLLEAGKIREANACLGSPYLVSGTVSDGAKRGREIGFPTVNLVLPDPCKQLPAEGVYIARTTIAGKQWMAMMNIGRRPTVSTDGAVTVEAHILDYAGELYETFLKFQLLDFIRNERQFESLDALRVQLDRDKKVVELYRE